MLCSLLLTAAWQLTFQSCSQTSSGILANRPLFFILSRNLALKIFDIAFIGKKKSIRDGCQAPSFLDSAPPGTFHTFHSKLKGGETDMLSRSPGLAFALPAKYFTSLGLPRLFVKPT